MARMGARISSTSLTAPLTRTARTSSAWISRWSHGAHRNQVALNIMAKQRACFSTAITTYHANHSSTASNGTQQPSAGNPIDTVNKDEIAKFSAMSDEWWAPQGPFKMLHLMNPPRIRYIRNRLEASGAVSRSMGQNNDGRFPLQGLRILDVGCGGGLLTEALARLGAHVTGLDASIENIQMARIHAKKDPLLNGGAPGSLEYRHQTAEQLLEQGLEFDVVCSMEVIEHVENPAGFLKVLGQLLKPDGDLILSTISRTPFAYFVTIFCAEHLMRMVPVGTHHWSKFINPEELQAGVQDLAKCQVLNIQGIGFNPLSGQWELMKSRDGTTAGDTGLLTLLGPPVAESANYFLAAKKISSP
ncbi:Hexaprenyldihydroxybenzoate methyltransferase, mitochondrial [Mortierella polycephala]|uniref:Ubiquinone biosynthesis O-methyltransferase, mitochondrial n=1 Tax=Mortierella polycephala TaxID=41804 RepID=A0A9P6U811_9FUNG|nr:Hexaprenyldihydroxybenzoate methyltransferase, mitochondrial [Mortierella polycephala]